MDSVPLFGVFPVELDMKINDDYDDYEEEDEERGAVKH